jgi:hypothetical protein
VLYNTWRLVDLLVKLAIDGKNRLYAALVGVKQFLTVAKQSTVSIRLTEPIHPVSDSS